MGSQSEYQSGELITLYTVTLIWGCTLLAMLQCIVNGLLSILHFFVIFTANIYMYAAMMLLCVFMLIMKI